jgi:hypothetical protein
LDFRVLPFANSCRAKAVLKLLYPITGVAGLWLLFVLENRGIHGVEQAF